MERLELDVGLTLDARYDDAPILRRGGDDRASDIEERVDDVSDFIARRRFHMKLP